MVLYVLGPHPSILLPLKNIKEGAFEDQALRTKYKKQLSQSQCCQCIEVKGHCFKMLPKNQPPTQLTTIIIKMGACLDFS